MIQPRDFFGSSEDSIKSLLTDGDARFSVPDYQRNYAWTINELSQLWGDFLKTIDDCFESDYKQEKLTAEPHFFGAIVLTETSRNNFEITDGQQRLTSSSILIKALCEVADKIVDSTRRSGIRNKLTTLIEKHEYGDPFEQRIYLDPTINDFYKNYILLLNSAQDRLTYVSMHPIKKNSSPQRIVDAYNFFHQKLKEEFPDILTQEEMHDKLLCYVNVFTRYFMVLKIIVYKKETAYMIFETLNKRGKDLSESDMIKNELFKSVESQQRDNIKDLWDKISEKLETENLTEYIRFQYASEFANVTPARLYEVIKKHINDNNAYDYLQKLVYEAEWFSRITLIDTTHWDQETIELLRTFKELDVSHVLPLILSGSVVYHNDFNSFKKLLKNTVTFCFRFFTISGNSVANLENEIGAMARVLRTPNAITRFPSKLSNIKSLDSLTAYMKSITDDSIFVKRFREFSTKSNSLAFYILNKLEKQLKTGVAPLPHGPSQHVEHIMPKNPSKSASRQNEWAHVKNDPNYKEFLFRLGNLIILESDLNQKVKNKDYSVKKVQYQNSGLYYPSQVATNYTIWDYDSIDNRQFQMSQTALQIWKYI